MLHTRETPCYGSTNSKDNDKERDMFTTAAIILTILGLAAVVYGSFTRSYGIVARGLIRVSGYAGLLGSLAVVLAAPGTIVLA